MSGERRRRRGAGAGPERKGPDAAGRHASTAGGRPGDEDGKRARSAGASRPAKPDKFVQSEKRGNRTGEPPFDDQRSRLRPATRRGLVGAAVLLIVALAFVVRVASPWSTVFAGPSGVRLFDTDSYYHLRHARYTTAHFPHLQAWDPGVYPNGQPRLYAGLFDVTIAAAALVAGGGHPSERRVIQVAAFVPAVLGALSVGALFWLGAATAGELAGLVALLLVTLYPGTFLHRSLLGAVDHHAAEVLLALLTTLGLAGAVKRGFAPGDGPAWRRWLPDVRAAAPLAVFFFTWFGAPIYLVLVAAAFFVVGTLLVARGDDVVPLARAACRYGTGLLIATSAVALVAPGLVMEAHTFKQTLLAAALFAAGCPVYLLALRRLAPPAAGRARSLIVALGGGIAVLALLSVAARIVPPARSLVDQLLGVKTNLVKEQAALTIDKVAYLGGAPAFLALLALPVALVAAWRRHQPTPAELARLMAVCLSTLVVLLWLRTRDYGYVAPPLLALLSADLLARAWRRARPGRARLAGAAVVATVLIVPLWPARATAPPVPERAALADFMMLRPGWEQALGWMRAHTPPLAEPLDAPTPVPFRHPAGNYGVQAFWDFGHYVAELGKRPPLASGGISVSSARWFLLDDEDAAVSALGHKLHPGERVRYCIADAQTVGEFALSGIQMAGESVAPFVELFAAPSLSGKRLMRFSPRFSRAMSSRLYEQNGDGLAHFRLVYASPARTLLAYHAPLGAGVIVRKTTPLADGDDERRWRDALAAGTPVVLSNEVVYDGVIGPSVKIFEQVPGARLTGTAPAGATVEARLDLIARASGAHVSYRRAATTDVTGHFQVMVPYPTEPDAAFTDVFATAPYDLVVTEPGAAAGRSVGRIAVSTDAVENGATVSVSAAAVTPAPTPVP